MVVRLTFMATNHLISRITNNYNNDYNREHNRPEYTIFIEMRFLTSYGLWLTTAYFSLASLLTIQIMAKKDSIDISFVNKTKQRLDLMSNFHLIIMSIQFFIAFGWFCIIKKTHIETKFAGSSSELKLFKDLNHSVSY